MRVEEYKDAFSPKMTPTYHIVWKGQDGKEHEAYASTIKETWNIIDLPSVCSYQVFENITERIRADRDAEIFLGREGM